MAEFPNLPLWTDAYLADTTHLSTEEHGAYLLLLICAWRTPDCALPDDDKRLARMAGLTPAKWRRMRPTIEAFFDVSDGSWSQKNLTKMRKNVRKKVDQKRKAGRASAKAKLLKSNNVGSTAVATEGQQNANGGRNNQNQNQNNSNNTDGSVCVSNSRIDADFDTTHIPRSPPKPNQKFNPLLGRALTLDPSWTPSLAETHYANSKGFANDELRNLADRFRKRNVARGFTSFDWSLEWEAFVDQCFANTNSKSEAARAVEAQARGFAAAASKREARSN